MILVPPIGWRGAVGGITSLTYQTHTTSTAAAITAPASINAGDLLVLIDDALGSPLPTAVVPTGFTQIGTDLNGANTKIIVSYKIADGTEDSSSITGMDGNLADRKVMLQYRADVPIASLSVSTPVTQMVDTNPAQQTVAASAGTGIVLGITLFSTITSSTDISPRTTSITPDHEISVTNKFYVHDYIQASSPADYTFDMGDHGNQNGLWGAYIHNMV